MFGWRDQRRIDDGLLKFSLHKQLAHITAEELSARLWTLLSSPGGYAKIHSQNMSMRTKIVQVVDHSNIVIWQEYQVEVSSSGDKPTGPVVRSLDLVTMFATESGYILLMYGLDPKLTALRPTQYLSPQLRETAAVTLEWLPAFCWCAVDRMESVDNQCQVSFVGTIPTQDGSYNWAVEVLKLALRCENLVIGPLWTLPEA